jgi:excisionase family DNA binding protein
MIADNQPANMPKLLRPAQVAEALAISRTSTYRLLETGELPSVRFGGSTVRVRADALQRFIEEHSNDGCKSA